MGCGVCRVGLVCGGRLIEFASEVVLMSWQVGPDPGDQRVMQCEAVTGGWVAFK